MIFMAKWNDGIATANSWKFMYLLARLRLLEKYHFTCDMSYIVDGKEVRRDYLVDKYYTDNKYYSGDLNIVKWWED